MKISEMHLLVELVIAQGVQTDNPELQKLIDSYVNADNQFENDMPTIRRQLDYMIESHSGGDKVLLTVVKHKVSRLNYILFGQSLVLVKTFHELALAMNVAIIEHHRAWDGQLTWQQVHDELFGVV